MRVILMQVNISENKAFHIHIHSEQVIYRPTAIQTPVSRHRVDVIMCNCHVVHSVFVFTVRSISDQ